MLSAAEVRPYVEHQLKHVGRKGKAIFSDAACAGIYAHTDGIPRRINLLCNRAMLAAFLRTVPRIEAHDLAQTAKELGAEVGEAH